jgi:hypothetical protein
MKRKKNNLYKAFNKAGPRGMFNFFQLRSFHTFIEYIEGYFFNFKIQDTIGNSDTN